MANSQTFTLNIKAVADMKDVATNIQNIQSALGKLKLPDNLKASFKTTFSSLEKELTKYQTILSNGIKTKTDANALEKSGNTIIRLYDDIVKKINSLDNSALKKAFEDMGAKEVENLRQQLTGLEQDLRSKLSNQKFIDFSAAKTELKSLTSQFQDATGQIDAAFKTISNSTLNTFFKNIDLGRLDLAEQNLAKIEAKAKELNNVDLTNWVQKLRSGFDQLKNSTEISEATSKVQQLKQELTTIKADTIAKLIQQFNQGKVSLDQLEKEIVDINASTVSWGQAQAQTNKELDQVKSRIQYFFGLNNAINLVKRAIRGAITTIKELDEAMTETAVVTDFTVSDMWEQLPEYTKRANELGVTTKAAYEAATLYYQQGLNTEEVTALSVETLKMARIAGLEAAEATDRMTNALRGFNMELNETNAQRVDDVYSRLAAISASNVDEISTAMTKVASLAHNAGMEFETTAAFLAQIIETTRESAETAGTALKTVVARFAEVKKLVDENELKGTDDEGEVIDVNKVSQALRSAGIDLNKYFLGEVGIDDIFMELAEKWDSLTSLQQRYIATQAAGSRQQSRFIALMSDYARTTELVGEAYNANGASAKQFAKTQESLESKLARLKNAWNEFLMGLTNSDVIKFGVDLLTNLLNLVNKLTSAFGEGAGSILKWVTAIATLRGASSFFRTGGGFDAIFKGNFGSNLVNRMSGAAAGGIAGGGGYAGRHVAGGAGAAQTTSVVGALGKSLWTGAQGIGNSLYGIGGAAGKTALSSGNAIAGLTGMGAGLAGVATALGVVAAAVGTVYIAYQKWLRLTPQGQIKLAEKHAKALNSVASAAEKNADEYREAVSEVEKYNKAVAEAETVSEHDTAIKDRNEYITSLIKQNAEYAKYVNYVKEDGEIVLTIDEASLQAAADAAEKAAAQAAANAYIGSAQVYNKSADYYRSLLAGVDLENRTITQGGTDGENGNVTWTRSLTNEEFARYTQYSEQVQQAVAQMEQEAAAGFLKLLESHELPDTIATTLSQVLAKGIDDTEVADPGALWWTHGEQYYLDKYEEITHQKLNASDVSWREAAEAYAQALQTSELQVRVNNLSEIVDTSANQDALERVLNTYLNQDQYNDKNLSLFNADDDYSIARLFGYDNFDDAVADLAKVAQHLGISNEELVEVLQKNIKQQREYQTKQVNRTAADIYAMGSRSGVADTTMVDFLKQFYELQNFDTQMAVADLFASISSTDLAGPLIENLNQAFKNGALDEEVVQWLENIDLSNPISGFAALSDAADSTNESIAAIATSILNNEQAMKQFSASNQLGAFLMSDSYEEVTEELEKLIKTNGEITSSNIRELAQENKGLNQLLKNGQISAKALATALNGIETGTVKMEDLSDAILAALNAMDDLDSTVKETIDDLNDFDPGYDENDITDFITTAYENAQENIEKGAYGNNVMHSYMQKIFGDFEYSGADEGYGDAYIAWLQRNMAWLEQNKDNMYSAWTDFSNGLANKQLELRDTVSGELLKTAEVFEQGGEIIIKSNGMTTEQLVQAMVQNSNLTEQQARMMIGDFKNYSADFAHEMAQNDLGNSITAWAENARTAADGSIVYTESEIQTLASLLGVSVDDVKAKISELSDQLDAETGEVKYKFQESLNLDTSNADNLGQALEELGYKVQGTKDDFTELSDANIQTDNIIDTKGLATACDNLELDFNETLNTLVGDAETYTALIDGSAEQISVKAGETAAEAYNRTVEEIKQADFVEAIGTAVSNALNKDGYKVKFVLNKDEVTGDVNLITQAIRSVPKNNPVNFPINTEAACGQVYNLVTAMNAYAASLRDVAAANNELASSGQSSGGYNGSNAPGVNSHALGGASGGYVPSYADGSTRKLPAGPVLTGEEGPEIIWNKDKGYAYITGTNHPEFQTLQPGDRIFNAQETRKILGTAATGGKVPAYAKGYGGTKKNTGGGSGGGSSSDDSDYTKESTWRNELDWLYDLMADIESYERQQTAIQKKYDLTLEDISATGKDLYNLTKKELVNLETQLDAQETAYMRRLQQMGELQTQVNAAGYGQYIQWNQQDKTIEIDWDAIEAIQDHDTYDEVTDWLDRMEEVQDQLHDAEEAMWDIKSQIQELQERYLEKYLDFQDKVLNAVVASYQSTIDNLSELNNTINNTNSSILESIQKEIDLERQIRDNTDTEKNITDLETRLAYLQRDTTGANAAEIRNLEKQLEEARESYSDTLVDQAVDRLQEQNESAQAQRERQIELMQAQLDYWQESGALWGEVANLISTGFTSNGSIIQGSDLWEVLKSNEAWDAMSEAQKKNWANELILETNEVGAHLIQLSGDNAVNAQKVRESISSERGILTQDISAAAEVVRASINNLTGQLGGTPEHSFTSEKTDGGYASGGLNDKTGFAMLHGTPSEPEYVLNARQTDAFLRLADVLPSAMSGNVGTTNNYGGNMTFQVDVNVGSIANDYDVDNLVARIKEDLYDAASYRNPNTLGFLR